MGGKPQTNARISSAVEEIISERAGLIGITRGAYLSLIAQLWFAQGCPALNHVEARLAGVLAARPKAAEKKKMTPQ